MRHALLLVFLLLALPHPSLAADLEPVKIVEGVYAFVGELGEPTVQNEGNVGNSGFIVGADGVVVVDTGISYRHGQAMLRAIARVTSGNVAPMSSVGTSVSAMTRANSTAMTRP